MNVYILVSEIRLLKHAPNAQPLDVQLYPQALVVVVLFCEQKKYFPNAS